MQPPRWFYLVISLAVGIVAASYSYRAISDSRNGRYTYERDGLVFDRRSGVMCEIAGVGIPPNCRPAPASARPAPAAMDTGMKMDTTSPFADLVPKKR